MRSVDQILSDIVETEPADSMEPWMRKKDNVRVSHLFDTSIFLGLWKFWIIWFFNLFLILVVSLSQKKQKKTKTNKQNKRGYLSLHIQCRQQMINCLLMRIQINAADAQIITTPYEAWTEI